jgi:hypothetical protein
MEAEAAPYDGQMAMADLDFLGPAGARQAYRHLDALRGRSAVPQHFARLAVAHGGGGFPAFLSGSDSPQPAPQETP